MHEIKNDIFFETAKKYPDSVIDYCLVANDEEYGGLDSHRKALCIAAEALSAAYGGWEFDISRAAAKRTEAKDLLRAPDKAERSSAAGGAEGGISYCQAFLAPPHGSNYTSSDFLALNSALFPKGTDELEAYQWTTDWFDYFNEGHEWWGTLCVTVYDSSLARFAVITASASD